MAKTLTQVELPSRAAWRAWLTEHHTQTESIWAVTFKKGTPTTLPSRGLRRGAALLRLDRQRAETRRRAHAACAPPQAGLGLVSRQQRAH
ncbi:MAG: hypothetical protein IPN01_17775 [Deltaproteobacteria bacterium]|nr:hypothetical protein [Deltaproteobacteria bacterium]